MFPVLFPMAAVFPLATRDVPNLSAVRGVWGGCGSNPRPADYEKHGPALRARYLHGCHGVVPPMALIAPFARVARSTNRSTTYYGR
jgi:hypothetical protein